MAIEHLSQASLFSEARTEETPENIIRSAQELYKPLATYALFSGGHDSLCATHASMQTGLVDAVVHINTTIGIPETREFVQKTCKRQGWPLIEKFPPRDYRSIVKEFGFPGPGFHGLPYARLKDRCIQRLVADNRQGKPGCVLFLTGCRRQESSRRMGNAKVIDDRERKSAGRVWAAPIVNWAGADKHTYMEKHGLERNPVYDFLCMSGECLCGAFAAPGEFRQIEMFYPHVAEKIRDIEREAQEAGVHAKWGTRPPRKPEPNQTDLEDYAGPMCWSCAAKIESLA